MQYKRELVKDFQPMILRYILSMPFIYGMIVPIVFLDICGEIYHRICFVLYKIPYVDRSKYIFLDRVKLSYLPWWDKVNCAYCGYANGVLAYVGAIAAETEKYWCAIKQPAKHTTKIFPHHKEFLPYGDPEALETFVEEVKTTKTPKTRPARKTTTKKPTNPASARKSSAIDLKKK